MTDVGKPALQSKPKKRLMRKKMKHLFTSNHRPFQFNHLLGSMFAKCFAIKIIQGCWKQPYAVLQMSFDSYCHPLPLPQPPRPKRFPNAWPGSVRSYFLVSFPRKRKTRNIFVCRCRHPLLTQPRIPILLFVIFQPLAVQSPRLPHSSKLLHH